MNLYPCPCCGYQVFSEAAGSYDICPICFWEDDLVQLVFPDMGGGANYFSLISSQSSFNLHRACEERFIENVRHPEITDIRDPLWRSLNPKKDRFLSESRPEDGQKWQSTKFEDISDKLYYWRPDFWLDTNGP